MIQLDYISAIVLIGVIAAIVFCFTQIVNPPSKALSAQIGYAEPLGALYPTKNDLLFAEAIGQSLHPLPASTVESTDVDGNLKTRTVKINRRTYEPYQIALLQQVEALLPVTAEEDVETIFSHILEGYKNLGYNVEEADGIITQFKAGNFPPIQTGAFFNVTV